MRIVFDTNSLIRSIPHKSKYRAVWESFVEGRNILCVSNEIIEEYTEILQKLTDSETAEVVVSTIVNSPFVRFITPYYNFNLIEADPDDNKFVDCAIAAHARYIVTDDHHYNTLKRITFPKVDVMSLSNFLSLINS